MRGMTRLSRYFLGSAGVALVALGLVFAFSPDLSAQARGGRGQGAGAPAAGAQAGGAQPRAANGPAGTVEQPPAATITRA